MLSEAHLPRSIHAAIKVAGGESTTWPRTALSTCCRPPGRAGLFETKTSRAHSGDDFVGALLISQRYCSAE